MNAKTLQPKNALALIKETYQEWSKDNCLRLGAALAYYSIFSIAPLILIAIGLVGLFYGQQAAQGQVSEQLSKVVGWQVAQSVEQLVASAGKTGKGATIVGFVTLLVGASGVFGQLKDALNTIWEVKPKPGLGVWGFIRTRLLTFGVVLVIGFLMLTSLIVTTMIAAFTTYIEKQFGIPGFISGALGFILPFAIEVLLFAMLYKFLPDAQVRWSNVWIGAAATALLFEIGKSGLSWYLARGGTTSSFGAGASLVLLLVWVYYTSLILFFGAEFTEVYARATGHVIQPKPHALKVQPCEREEQGMEPDIVPHPSPAAAMAGRDPNTGSQKGEGRPGGSPEAESHPSVLRPAENTPGRPRKERLAPLRYEDEVSDDADIEVTIAERAPTWLETAQHNPFAQIGGALGVGLILGTISRMTERPKPVSAGEHLRLGGKAAALAAATLLAKYGHKVAGRINAETVADFAAKAAKTVRAASERIPEKFEEVRR